EIHDSTPMWQPCIDFEAHAVLHLDCTRTTNLVSCHHQESRRHNLCYCAALSLIKGEADRHASVVKHVGPRQNPSQLGYRSVGVTIVHHETWLVVGRVEGQRLR